MSKNINIKRLLFEIIILLFSIGLLFWICTPSNNLGEQFTFTMIGVMITVFVIDYLLIQDKKQRYKIINKGISKEVIIGSQIGLLKIMDIFGYLKTPEERSIMKIGDINYTKEKIKLVLESEEYKTWLSSLTLNQETLKKLNDLKDVFSSTYKNLRESLYRIQPHPDPVLIEKIKNNQAKIDGSVMAIKLIIEKFKNGLPKELIKKNTEDTIILEAMPVLIKIMIVGFDKDSISFMGTINENLEFLQLIAERADNNNLEYTLE